MELCLDFVSAWAYTTPYYVHGESVKDEIAAETLNSRARYCLHFFKISE